MTSWEKRVEIGTKVEREHRDLVPFLNARIAAGCNVHEDEIYRRIALAHLKEDPEYYRKLKEARL